MTGRGLSSFSDALFRSENDLRHDVPVPVKGVVHDGNGADLKIVQRESLAVEAVEPRFVNSARAPARRRVAKVLKSASVLRYRPRIGRLGQNLEERDEAHQRIVVHLTAGEHARVFLAQILDQ